MKKPASLEKSGGQGNDSRRAYGRAIGRGEAVPTTNPPANLKSFLPSQTMRRDRPSVVVCGHGAGSAVRFVNAAGNFVGFLAEQTFAAVAKRDEAAAVRGAINKADGAHTNGSRRLRR